MLFRICRSVDDISKLFSDPLILLPIVLSKDKKVVRFLTTSARNLVEAIRNTTKALPDTSLIHFRITTGNVIIRIFSIKDVAVACVKEDLSGQVIVYGASALEDLSKMLEQDVQVSLLIEEIPLKVLESQVSSHIQRCIEEAEKPWFFAWRSKGLYGFRVEEVISDRGAYTYVLKAVDPGGDVKVLKVLKEEVAVGKSFSDLLRGYINSLMLYSLNEQDLNELAKLSGYSPDLVKELFRFRRYIAPVRAVLILRDRLERSDYLANPPTVVEDYASRGDLEAYIQSSGGRGIEETMYIASRVLGAVALAHLIKVAHLNIKPRNILLFDDRQERFGYIPKVTDFSEALGDPRHGYRISRVSPGFSDPLALARGVADPSYDAYSIAMVIAFTISGAVPKHRLLLNALLLQNIYNYPVTVEKVRDDEKPLKDFMKAALNLVLQLKSKSISWQDFVQKISDDVESLDLVYMPWINEAPKTIATVIRRGMTLKPDARYRSCVEMWTDLRDAIIKEGLSSILPSQ